MYTGGAAVDGPNYRFPVLGFLALTIAPVTLGIARRAIDELIDLASGKTPMGMGSKLRERSMTQFEIGKAESILRSARAWMYELTEELWDKAVRGDEFTMKRARAAPHVLRARLDRIGARRGHRLHARRRHLDLRDERAAALPARRAHRHAARHARPAELRDRRPPAPRPRSRHPDGVARFSRVLASPRLTTDDCPDDLLDAIMTTRAIRRYTDEPVTDEEIATCLRAAVQAPNNGNIQPWQFVVITDPATKQTVGDIYRKSYDRFEAAYNKMAPPPRNEDDAAHRERMKRASRYLADHIGEAPAMVAFLMPKIDLTDAR